MKLLTVLTVVVLSVCATAPPISVLARTRIQSTTQNQPAPSQRVKAAIGFGLEDSTPVRMRITRTISSADAQVNDRVDFEVLDEIKVEDVIMIPRGAIAWGTVTEAHPRRR